MKYALILLSFIVAGCSSIKRTVTHTTVTHDTVLSVRHDTITRDSISYIRVVIHDTVIVTPAAKATQTVDVNKLVPGATYQQSNGHARSTLYLDSAGLLHASCECDSLKTVVRGLVERNTYLERTASNKTLATTDQKSITADRTTDYQVKVKSWLQGNWWWLVVVLIIFIVGEIYIKFIKPG